MVSKAHARIMNSVIAMACFGVRSSSSGANQIATGSAIDSTQPMRSGQPAEGVCSGGSAATDELAAPGQLAGACSPI